MREHSFTRRLGVHPDRSEGKGARTMNRTLLALAATALLVASPAFADVTVKATNTLSFDRPSQTIEVTGKDLTPLEVKDLTFVHVKDASGKELLAQAVDTDFDEFHRPD